MAAAASTTTTMSSHLADAKLCLLVKAAEREIVVNKEATLSDDFYNEARIMRYRNERLLALALER